MADTPKHSVSVAGIVVDDQDRVLVIQRRDNGHWEPPGGVLELDEAPEDGVEREVQEETGYKVAAERLSGVYKNMERSVVALVFRCRLVGGERQLTDESVAVAWRKREDLRHLMDEAYYLRVEDAFGDSAAVRVHDGRSVIQT